MRQINSFNCENTGNFIRSLRKERSLTIEQIAKYIGVTKSAVSQWESGKGIKPEMLYSLARLFNISVDELVNAKRKSESNSDFFKRNYDLSLCEFGEDNIDDKLGDEYFSKLRQIKKRFFTLIHAWVLDELSDNSKEELDFLSEYFERDNNYLAYLKYGAGYMGFFNEKDVKEIIKEKLESLVAKTNESIYWELEKFYHVKKEWMKDKLVCNARSNYLLGKLLLVMNQPEKDILLAINLKREESKSQSNGFSEHEVKTKRDLTLSEIENSPYLKIMMNAGCNIMKQLKSPSCIEKEDIDSLEGEISDAREEISLNDDTRPYMQVMDGNGLVGSLQYWKMYSYEEYKSFIDERKTEYYRALVNFKKIEPLKYYEALKKYYRGE